MKHLKKTLALALSLLMMLTAVPISVLATDGEPSECICTVACETDAMNADCPVCGIAGALPENCRYVASGAWENGFTWILRGSTLTVTGSGAMPNVEPDLSQGTILPLVPWKDNIDDIQKVIVSGNVTTIGEDVFSYHKNLLSVELPSSLTAVGDFAFYECEKLAWIALPDSVTTIGEQAFRNCKKLALTALPENLTSIGTYAFIDCESLKLTALPSKLKHIGGTVFRGCTALTDVILPAGLETMYGYAFSDCTNLRSLTFLGQTAPVFGYYIVNRCDKLEAVYVPVGATGYDNTDFANKIQYVIATVTTDREMKGYSGIHDAFDYANGKTATVRLLTDVNAGGNYFEFTTGSLTFEGGDYTLRSTKTSNFTFYCDNTTFTMNSGTIIGELESFVVNTVTMNGGNVTLISNYGGTVTVNGGTVGKVASTNAAGNTTITGGEITELFKQDSRGTFRVSGGKRIPNITGAGADTIEFKVTGELTGLTGIGDDVWVTRADNYVVVLTPEGGFDLPSKDDIRVTIGGEEYTGFSYSEDKGAVIIPKNDINGAIKITANGVDNSVAQIENGSAEPVKYTSLPEAIADAQKAENAGCTVKVLKDVTVANVIKITGGKFTLDAGEYMVNGSSLTLFEINGNGTVTITGGRFKGVKYAIRGLRGTLNVTGGAFDSKVLLYYKTASTAGMKGKLSGGSFQSIHRGDDTVGTETYENLSSFLEIGYTFRKTTTGEWIAGTAAELLSNVNVVPIPVSIKTQPQGGTIPYGNSHTLTVTAEKNEAYADKEIGYQWYRVNTSPIGEDEIISGATSATYATPDTLTPGTYRYYCEVTVDGYTVKSETATVTVTTAKLATPTNLRIESSAPGELTASWDAVENAASYEVQLCVYPGVVIKTVTLPGTSYTFDGFEHGDHYFKVKAIPADADPQFYVKSDAAISTTLHFYRVTFDSNGAGDVPTQFVARGNKANEPTGVEKTEHTLAYWMDENGEVWYFDNPIYSPTFLTAVWTANIYTVTLNTNGGTINSGNVTGYTYGQGATLPTNVTRSGFTFDGWYDNAEFSGTAVTEITATDIGNKVYFAKWTDIQAPIGVIKIDINLFTTFLNRITFNLFFKETQRVTITAIDNSGEAVKIEFLVSSGEIDQADLAKMVFHAYTEPFNIIPDGELIIYAKLTDKSGNVRYISTDGLVLDATAPVISGVEDGKTYCAAQTVTVTEKYLDTVTVNGTEIELDENNQFVLNPANGTQTVVVTDKAGNSTTVTVTVNNGHTPAADDGDCTTPVYCIHDNVIVIAAKEHDFTGDWQKDETHHWHECENDGCTVTDTKIAHSGDDDGDCTTAVACVCGATVKAAETAHSWSAWTQDSGKDTHTHSCQNEGCTASETKPCTGGTATCHDKAKCEVCAKEHGALAPSIHTDLKHFSATEATKTAEGNIEYWYCSGCNKYYKDAAATQEIKQADTVTAKLPGGTVTPGTDKNPQTGDSSNMTLWLILLAVSGGAVLCIIFIGRKKRHSAK